MRSLHLFRRPLRALALVAVVGIVAACGPAPETEQTDAAAAPGVTAGPEAGPAAGPATSERVAVVHKSPTCECCGAHEDYLAAEGYTVEEAIHEEDLTAWKEARGIPRALWSCHTTEVGGYLVEGHVPADTIARLIARQPDVDGIALPGMPAGAPGMPGMQDEPWVIEAFVAGEPAGVFETR